MRCNGSITSVLALLLLTTSVIFFSGDSDGGKDVFSASVRVTPDNFSNWQNQPSDIEVAPDGTIYVLLLSNMRSFKWGAYITRSEDGGLTWSQPTRVDDIYTDGNASNDENVDRQFPRMAVGPDGTIYVVWEDHRHFLGDYPGSRPIEIRFSKSMDKGDSFIPSRKIDPVKDVKIWHGFRPDIAVNDDGRLVVVWQDLMDSGAYRNIFSIYSTDGGSTWSQEVLLNTDGLNYRNHENPRLAMSGDDVYVTWHDTRNISVGPKVFLVKSHDGGITYSSEINVTDDTEEERHRTMAEPALDDSGNLYIAWNDDRSGSMEIWMTRSSDKGATLERNFRVARAPERSTDNQPVLAAIGDGILSVSWYREFFDMEARPIERDVLYLNSTDGGRTWSPMLRVDDTDRFEKDPTDQDNPKIAWTPEGRSVLCWADGRDYLPIELNRHIYFARHSGSLSGPNLPPVLSGSFFHGPFAFNSTIGNGTTEFDFKVVYSDYDNDMPRSGYPRMRIYRDDQGLDPFTDWILMYKTNESDVFYIEGVEYSTSTAIPEEGTYFWGVETMEERASVIVRTPIFPGPRIDTTPPSVVMLGPEERNWMNSDVIECSARVTDTGGSHVDPRSIKYQKSFNAPNQFERGVAVNRYEEIDADTFDGFADVQLDQGKENYVRFEARDMVGNGATISDHINLWIDSVVPYYTQLSPVPADIRIYPTVNCSIVFLDHIPGSSSIRSIGLDPSTIMYQFRTVATEISEWMVPEGIQALPDNRYLAWVHLQFADKGVYNFINWRAADLLGNLKVTGEKRINVDIPENYAPVFVGGAFPNVVASETPHIWWEDAYDEEGDTLYYKVMIKTGNGILHFTRDIDVGRRTFFDVPDDKRLDPGQWTLEVNVTDRIGGWDLLVHNFRVTDVGTPPPSDLPGIGPYYLSDPNSTVGWAPSPSAATRNLTYLVRIGTEQYMRDVIDWTDVGPEPRIDLSGLGLGIGIYSMQVMAFADENYSRVAENMLKVSDYSPRIDAPTSHQAYRGAGASKAKTMEITVWNPGTHSDNITIFLEGEIADKGWVSISTTQTITATVLVPSSKGLTTPITVKTIIVFSPPGNAQEGEYELKVRAISEDGETVTFSDDITVTVKDAPEDSKGGAISQGIYNLVTKIFPFLEGLPQWLVVLLFFLLIVLIIGGIVAIGIFVAKRGQRKRSDDPYEKQKQLYRDLYGAEPPEDFKGEAPAEAEPSFDVDKLFDEEGSQPSETSAPAEDEVTGGPVPPAEGPSPIASPQESPGPTPAVTREGDTLIPE